LLSQQLNCALLLLTDYASMELYSFSSEPIHRVLIIAAPNSKLTGEGLLAEFLGPLQFLFSVRATNLDLQFGLAWIESFERFFAVEKGTLVFDDLEFMKRYLVDRLPNEEVTIFNDRLATIQSKLTSDVRCRIRGHDFVRMFTWYLRTIEKCKHLNEDSVLQMLYMSIRLDDLASKPLFMALQDSLGHQDSGG